MGFFSNLFSSKKKSINKTDRIYLTRKAANKAIINYVLQSTMDSKHVIIIYFFKETRHEFESEVTNANNVVWVNAHFSAQVKTSAIGGLDNTNIIVAETYPDFNVEQNLLEIIQEIGYDTGKVIFFNGLDDPIFIPFGAERIQKLMISMGMSEDEPIEHAMISKSIDRAQQKVTAKKMLMSRIDSRAEMIRQLSS
jgi:preprotein translocase subunit SecA